MKVVRDDTRENYAGFNESIKHGNIILLEGVDNHLGGGGGKERLVTLPDLIKDHMFTNINAICTLDAFKLI